MKLKIALCENEPLFLAEEKRVIIRVLEQQKSQYEWDEYTDAESLLSSGKSYDFLFMDIELGNDRINGVEAGKQIHDAHPDCLIFFITNYEEYIDEVIHQHAFRYWSKPLDEYRLTKSLLVGMAKKEVLSIHTDKHFTEIPLQKIIYVTPFEKKCKIVTVNHEYIVPESLKEIKERITVPYFSMPHASYLVNLHYVDAYNKNHVYLKNGDQRYEIYISRRHYKDFKNDMYQMGGEWV